MSSLESKLTENSKEIISHATMHAVKLEHQYVLIGHLLHALFKDDNMIRKICDECNIQHEQVTDIIKSELKNVPSVSTSSPSQPIFSTELLKSLNSAIETAEENDDKYVTVERLLEGVLLQKRGFNSKENNFNRAYCSESVYDNSIL